ncbi:uncharacterized protein UV8b_00773 [Ustilaginoidea virens]|uniref:Uncharacterized protein n=1 Tax=Ustilaginoidea virens TaxID=1159556 RepID=A0A8E5MEE3_USTVR|nr:uncharacterized protein UV8b_00773 [Ustilaginoidea virens]QUC16532.1 hypothetical protein UV8b_00773 [Ustilaginoidea virens]
MSGGFYKYRCKYFYTHNCENWVWVNNAPCATCLAVGRDDETLPGPVSMQPRDISVPSVQNGVLQYTLKEFVAPTEPSEHWTLRDKAAQPPPAVPVTSAMPSSSGIISTGMLAPGHQGKEYCIPPHSEEWSGYRPPVFR